MAERRESVRLELNDAGFSTGMAKSAAATGLLERALKSLDGTNVVIHERISESATQVDRLSKSSRDADKSINQLTGRLRLFADAAAILGPALVPIGGVALAGIAGLSSQLGFAAIGAGVLVGSMQGLGDALGALNDAHLEPTAENLTKAKDALNSLSPAAAKFAEEAYGLLPVLRGIRDAGAEGLFPGLTESLDDLERLAPVVADIFNRIGSAVGEIAADGAASLASERWADFFDFIAVEGPRALTELSTAVGSLVHGLSELWMAFAPLNSDVSGWLMDAAAGFDAWASGLSKTQGFRDFVEYVRETGPQVADTMGALANAVVQIVQAAAPLGGPILKSIEGLADALASLADSSVGSALIAAAAGFAAVSRAMAVFNMAKGSALAGMMTDLSKNGEQAGKGARALGAGLGALLAIPAIDAAQTQFEGLSMGLNALSSELTTLGANGSLSGEFDNLAESLTRLSDPNLAQGLQDSIYNALPFLGSDSRVDEATAQFEALDAALVNIVNTEGPAQAKVALENLAASLGLTAEETRELLTLLPGYEDAIIGAADAASAAAADHSYRDSLAAETAALEKNIGLMQAKRDAALRSFSAQTEYSQSLLDSKKALEENGRAWGLNSEAGLKNRRVVEQQAASWNQLNREQGQTPAQARVARKALEDTAVSLGATKEEARRYARQLMDIPNDLSTKIALDVDTAVQRAKAIKAELASIDRNIDVYVNVRRPNAGGFGPQVGGSADGGTVPKTGKPYADRHLYLLADGEEVISNRRGQADRHRSLLKDINAGRLADGGTTGKNGGRVRSGVARFDDTDRLQAAIDRLTLVAEDQTRAVEKSTAKTEMWAEKMADAGKNTLSTLGLNMWDSSSSPWESGAGSGALFNLTRTNAGLEERLSLQQQLAALGLSGDALSQLLTGSNADISGMIQRGEIGQYAALFAQYQSLSGAASTQAGQLAYGAQYEAANADRKAQLATLQATERLTQRMEHKLARMEKLLAVAPQETGAAVGAAVQNGATNAHRDNRNQTGARRA
jgi:hypothetical protein